MSDSLRCQASACLTDRKGETKLYSLLASEQMVLRMEGDNLRSHQLLHVHDYYHIVEDKNRNFAATVFEISRISVAILFIHNRIGSK